MKSLGMKVVVAILIYVYLFPTTLTQSELPNTNQTILNISLSFLFQVKQVLYYKFAILWPKGYCREYVDSPCYKNPKYLPNFFTIHGLWVIDKSEPKIPSSQEFDQSLLGDVEEDMKKYWPHVMSYDLATNVTSERHDKENLGFWKKEWDRHGRFDLLFKMRFHEYFRYRLEIFDALTLNNIIIDQAGKPGTPQLLLDALQLHQRTIPSLLCIKDKATEQVFLSEMQFCMDATATAYVDCIPEESKDKKKCEEGQTFVYDFDEIARTPSMNEMFEKLVPGPNEYQVI